jgi:hypothetical protein
MKHQRGSTSYNKQFRSSGVSRAIRISRDPRSVATRPVWLSDVLETLNWKEMFARKLWAAA